MNPSFGRSMVTLGFTRWEWSLFLIVLGTHLAFFSYAGSPLPYYDQWLAEYNSTLLSIAAGKGSAALLFRHNEHLLFTTKTLTLLGYLINGYWDVPFLAVCSAGIRALAAAWIFQLVSPFSPPRIKVLLWLLCAVLFVVPLSGYNLLNGMQVSYYLVDCALICSLRVTANWTSPVKSGLALVGCLLFGLGSFASAVAIPFSTLSVHLLQRRSRPGFWAAWAITVLLALGFVLTTAPAGAPPANLSWGVLLEKITFWFQIVSWPTGVPSIGALLSLLGIAALIVAHRSGCFRTGANAIILGLAVYAAMNAVFIAVNRTPSEWHMRHWDTIAFLPLAAIAFGLRLAALNIFRRPVLFILGAFTLCYLFYAGNLLRTVSWPYIHAAHENRSAAVEYYRRQLQPENLAAERSRLYLLFLHKNDSFFDEPIGRFSLHPDVIQNMITFHPGPLSMLSPEITSGRSPSRFSWFTGKFIAYGWLLSLIGVGLGIVAARRELGKDRIDVP